MIEFFSFFKNSQKGKALIGHHFCAAALAYSATFMASVALAQEPDIAEDVEIEEQEAVSAASDAAFAAEAAEAGVVAPALIDPFAALLTRRGPSAVRFSSRQPQLYETTQGDETFVFQVLGQEARIRFLCDAGEVTLECELLGGKRAEEVHLLFATRSPRGDVIYKDPDGQPVLRVTSNGGATLFPPAIKAKLDRASVVPFGGKAVLPVVGQASSLRAPSVTYDLVETRMRDASDLIARRYSMLITFVASAPALTFGQTVQADQAVLADAVLTAAKGVDMVAADALGARVLDERLEMIQFVADQQVGLDFENGTLTIRYNALADLQGRPSSVMIARYLENVL